MVEPVGIEPTSAACKAAILPLNEGPMNVRPHHPLLRMMRSRRSNEGVHDVSVVVGTLRAVKNKKHRAPGEVDVSGARLVAGHRFLLVKSVYPSVATNAVDLDSTHKSYPC